MQNQAVKINGKGGTQVLAVEPHEIRKPGPGEVRVQVRAAGLNRADLLQRMGYYPAPPNCPPDIPGLEYAGVIESLGAEVSGWTEGQAVMGIVGGGAMASQVVVHFRELMPVPQGMELSDAAAIPEVFLTAYDALFAQGNLSMGQVALIHAAGSGIGTAAIQLAHQAGATTVATTRSSAKLAACHDLRLGLDHGLTVTDKTFAKAVQAATGGRGADVVLDTVGAAYLAENVKATAAQGAIVTIGLLGGATGELPMGLVLAKRISLIGTVLRSRTLEEKATLVQRFNRDVLPLFDGKRLRPIVDRTMPVSEIAAAHQYMADNSSFGKVIITFA